MICSLLCSLILTTLCFIGPSLASDPIVEQRGLLLPTTPFFLIRHGETDWNREGRIQGHRPIPLNEKGRGQAREAALALIGKGIQRIISSNLGRAYETAEIIREILILEDPIQVHDALSERFMGSLEGCCRADLLDPNADLSILSAEDGEPFDDFYGRVIQAIGECIYEKGTLIVTHGGVFNVFMDAIGFKNRRTQNAIPVFVAPPTGGQIQWGVTEMTKDMSRIIQ